ncbi:MAG: SapC family protein [Burkholderiaceae bacterium]
MAQLTVISREQHAGKRWKRYSSYSFAAADAVAPLVVQELPRACMAVPVGFVKKDDGYQLVAVQGLQPGRNLLVGGDGRWLAGYVPAVYRGYPFAVATTADNGGRQVLCFREDSGLLVDDDTEGEAFFDADGKPAKTVSALIDFLEQVAASGQLTARLCALLDQYGVIAPWNVTLKAGDTERKVDGLYRIDEKALIELPADAFEALRQAGALPLVYAQLLSMQHLSRLGKLATHRAQAQSAENQLAGTDGDLDLEFLHDDGNIRFN